MFFSYVLKSQKADYYYKGHCVNLKLRLDQHNSGKTVSTRPYLPFDIIYFEEFETQEGAIEREKYFKTSAGRRFLKTKIVS